MRHWDTWADGTRNHLYALALDAKGDVAGNAIPLTKGFDGDVPGKPFGGDEDFDIGKDGKTVIFTARLAGRTEPWSTNFDLYATPMDGSAAPKDLTADNPAWDGTPAVSPDGTKLAYLAMKRPGFEADAAVLQSYRQAFPNDPAATNLAQWHQFETANPAIFAGMYQFWVQKAD